MEYQVHGELVPVGGGDPVPLTRKVLTMGRRESCDICLKFANVSGLHCELSFKDGYWVIRDLGSTNGIKVNGTRVAVPKPLRPGDEIAIANRRYTIQYNLVGPSFDNLEAQLSEDEDMRAQSLLEKAGLAKPKRPRDDE